MKKIKIFFTTLAILIAWFSSILAISLNPTNIIIAKNDETTAQISLNQENTPYTIDIYNKNIATIRVDKKNNKVYLKGINTGQTILMIVDTKGNISAARVSVKEKAGNLPDILSVQVTGKKTTNETIRNAIETQLKVNSSLQPGASLKINQLITNETLHKGEWSLATVQAEISGENYFSVNKDLRVIIQNLIFTENPENKLIISNNPEVLQTSGILLSEQVNNKEAVRVIYHHGNLVNSDTKEIFLSIENTSASSIRIYCIQGISGPSTDSLFVGHSATKRFIQNTKNLEGLIIDIPAGKNLLFSKQTIPAGKYVSGIFRFEVLEGDYAKIVINSSTSTEVEIITDKYHPKDNVLSHFKGNILTPNINMETTINCNKAYQEFEIGMQPELFSEKSGQKLVGNYGLYHNYKITLLNKTLLTKEVKFSIISRGGFNRGCFLINNKLLETKLLDPYSQEKEELYSLTISPESQKTISLKTFPQPGSYYPIRILVTSS